MRKGKRFTPALLRAFEKLGRGEGERDSYRGWHQVTRRDPPSRGTSGWLQVPSEDRMADHLSLGEEIGQGCARMAPRFSSGRENLPLSLHPHEGDFAEARRVGRLYPFMSEKSRATLLDH